MSATRKRDPQGLAEGQARAPINQGRVAQTAEGPLPRTTLSGIPFSLRFCKPQSGSRTELRGSRQRVKTVVVELDYPELASSASLSQGFVYVSRFADGYRIWHRAH